MIRSALATSGQCAACGAASLAPHLRVAGRAGDEGLIPTTDRYGTALADIVRCASCGHMQLATMPSEAELAAAYREAESDAYVEEEAGQRETAREILARIERHTSRGALADLGCWVGFFSDEARARGWEVLGVEPSRSASEHARQVLGLEVITADIFDAGLPTGSYQAVFMGDVIEHIPAAGDAVTLARELLAPRGVLAMTLPDAGSRVASVLGSRWWSVLPTHVHYFTRHSMAVLLDRHGYEVLEFATAPKAFTVGYYLGRIAGYNRRLGQGLTAGARAIGLADRLWAPDFRDRMLAIARVA